MSKEVFDLSSLDCSETTTITLLHPATGEPTKAKITLYGKDSEKYREARHKAEAKYTEFARKHKGKKFMPPEDRDKLEKAVTAACVHSWENIVDKGKALECNFENAKVLFQRVPAWREQCEEAIDDRELFIKG